VKDFWKKRWEDKDIPWHQPKIEPLLEKYFPTEPRTVFVPLCGKSLDLFWLSKRGHQVVGSELSEIACEEFFNENQLPVQISKHGEHSKFKSGPITLWAGDFFSLPLESLGEINAIYDRASLYALPPGEIREKYVKKIKDIAKKMARSKFEILLLGRETSPAPVEGPPYMISENDIQTLFSDTFQVKRLESMVRDPRADIPGKITESAYKLTLR
jgi:thiopurine S-methyltransferase